MNLEKYQKLRKDDEDLPKIRRADVDNNNKDGGSWLIVHGRVYDVHAFRTNAPCGTDILAKFIG